MDKDKPILTQEMFDEALMMCGKNIRFDNYVVEDITSESFLFIGTHPTIRFSNCVIKRLSVNAKLEFVNCEIVDYEQVFGINNCKQLVECTFTKPIPLMCPEEGEFIAFKQCIYEDSLIKTCCIVKLLIPSDAKRSSAFGNKCRSDKAEVLAIYDVDGNELKNTSEVYSHMKLNGRFKGRTAYKIGEMVYSDDFDENRFNECSHGIHFFMSFDEARDYMFF